MILTIKIEFKKCEKETHLEIIEDYFATSSNVFNNKNGYFCFSFSLRFWLWNDDQKQVEFKSLKSSLVIYSFPFKVFLSGLY